MTVIRGCCADMEPINGIILHYGIRAVDAFVPCGMTLPFEAFPHTPFRSLIGLSAVFTNSNFPCDHQPCYKVHNTFVSFQSLIRL